MKEKPLCVWRDLPREILTTKQLPTHILVLPLILHLRPIRILVLVLQIMLDRQNIGISIATNMQPSEYWY